MSTIQETIENSTIYGLTASIFTIPITLFLILLTILHGFKTYQDIYTSTRKSVSNRSSLPPRTKQYKFIIFNTFLTMILYNVYDIGFVLTPFSQTDLACDIIMKVQSAAFAYAKATLYLVLLGRLYMVYEKSVYCYSLKYLRCIGITIILYATMLTIAVLVVFKPFVDTHGNGKAYPNFCGTGNDTEQDGISTAYVFTAGLKF